MGSTKQALRVLVTNARSQQAYACLAGLRPCAEHLVIASHSRRRIGALTAPSYQSRLADSRYVVPPPPKGWLHPEPTLAEVQYIDALLAICGREAINIVIPSADEVVYALSRHKHRFADRGITVAVADFDVQSHIMDKARMLRTAELAGISVPMTFVPRTRQEADAAIDVTGLPAVIKPAFDAGGEGLRWVIKPSDLDRHWRAPAPGKPDLLIQEFIPGPISPWIYGSFTVMDNDGQIRAMFTHQRLRYARWHICMPHAASVSTTDAELRAQTAQLLRAFRYWGAACVEWKRDPRDGRLKLLEPNGRMGAPAWPALAANVNIPLILAQVALGYDSPPSIDEEAGRFYVDPVVELLALGTYIAHGVGQMVIPTRNPGIDTVPGLKRWFEDVRQTYGSGLVTTSDLWRAIPRDPLPGLLFWLDQLIYTARSHADYLPRR